MFGVCDILVIYCTLVFTQVSTNGYIVLWPNKPTDDVALPTLPPVIKLRVPFIAPFWANISTKVKVKRKTLTQGYVLTRVIKGSKSRVATSWQNFVKKKFKIKYMSRRLLLVEWLQVTYAGGSKKTEVGQV